MTTPDGRRSMYYDRDGLPISETENRRLHRDLQYVRVARTVVTDRATSKTLEISTVWLGFDYGFGYVPVPIIFETAILGDDGVRVPYRACTLADAQRGHALALATTLSEMSDPLVTDADNG